ncbi:hypothetical protein SAMN05216174_11574 [Actinokineospora iranica]|uniref:Uncharacterized protein n=1 Tax=Actinokineospora iranica TaxID=1271860 RepID=A0A1G6WLG2_9PSEU|nr:hypothetical protein SAMN05216174_11574 [Actinokineospora iranica]
MGDLFRYRILGQGDTARSFPRSCVAASLIRPAAPHVR